MNLSIPCIAYQRNIDCSACTTRRWAAKMTRIFLTTRHRLWGLHMAIPRLETARLILREWQEGDFDAYASLCVDPEVMRSLGGTTLSVLEGWRHMAYLVGHWALRGF